MEQKTKPVIVMSEEQVRVLGEFLEEYPEVPSAIALELAFRLIEVGAK